MTQIQEAPPQEQPRASRTVGDMARTLLVVAAILGVILLVNYRAPQDPVNQIEPAAMAASVAAAVDYPLYLPADDGWRATSARWEPTGESGEFSVWYTGGVFGEGTPFAALSQSAADSTDYVAEQTGGGRPVGESTVLPSAEAIGAGEAAEEQVWQRYESRSGRSLVRVDGATIVVTGTGSWEDVERFAASLVPVQS